MVCGYKIKFNYKIIISEKGKTITVDLDAEYVDCMKEKISLV
ncbi:MAG: hypothetical protein ACTJGH_04290 [Peptoniphilaceae bacterium]